MAAESLLRNVRGAFEAGATGALTSEHCRYGGGIGIDIIGAFEIMTTQGLIIDKLEYVVFVLLPVIKYSSEGKIHKNSPATFWCSSYLMIEATLVLFRMLGAIIEYLKQVATLRRHVPGTYCLP